MYKRILPVLLVCVALIVMLTVAGTLGAAAENTVTWVDVAENAIPNKGQPSIVPQKFRLVATNLGVLSSVLATAPLERSADAAQRQVIVALPLPNGGVGRFSIVASPIMAPELAATFPAITTYSGQGLDDPAATVRLDRTPAGFHALILSNGDPIYIDPYSPQNLQHYISYFRRDYRASEDDLFDRLNEQVIENPSPRPETQNPQRPSGAILRTYRLAMAATGEYTAFHGGTVAGGQAAIVTSVNRVNAVYEREVAVRMILVANNNLLVYTNGNTDPYTNDDGFAMLDENQNTIDAVIGSANYDIGHVFSTGGGGVAQLGVVCDNSAKAEGVTGRPQPIGDPFDIDYVAHEIGHQFDALHTFNSTTDNCGGGNRSPSAAYEPGSGSTVMAYAGICGADDLQPNSDAYFHSKSYEEITNFITLGGGNSCAAQSATGNTPPTVDAGATYIIPAQTPFTLTGIGNDADGDVITYNWEEYDLGAASPPNTDNGNRPIFRSFNASSSPSRTFPKLSDILTNTSTFGELLPTTNRTLNFRLTVRDNRAGGGGVAVDTTALTVTNTAGPFRVFVPNSAVTWSGGSNYAVQWDKANTDLAPINCATVNILFSSDGGLTFPTTLATSQQNDGIHVITIPNINTSLGRIKVGCATNIFFDISNANFTVTQVNGGTPVPTPTGPTETPFPFPTNTPVDTATPTSTPVPSGGPDAFGYCFRDSNNGQVYSFIDISGTGTALTFSDSDDATTDVMLPFSFSLYGTPFTSVNVSTNGFLRFTGTNPASGNDSIPDPATPNNLIAPFWDDLVLTDASGVRTQTVGTAGSREFIVQWTNVTRFDEDTLRFTFQLRLRETSNEIVFAYYLQGAPPTAPDAVVSGMNGNEASVGIENATGTIGLQYSFDTASLANNLLIRFVPSGCFSGGGTPTATVGTTTPTTTATTTPVLSNKLYLPLIMR